MKTRDKILSNALKQTFPPQTEREKRLLMQIESRLPARKNRLMTIPLMLNIAAIIGCVALFFTINWNETTDSVIKIVAEYLKNGISFSDIPQSILLPPMLVITIIWLLYNTIGEYLNNRNMDILEQALKQRP